MGRQRSVRVRERDNRKPNKFYEKEMMRWQRKRKRQGKNAREKEKEIMKRHYEKGKREDKDKYKKTMKVQDVGRREMHN